ncbi:MAG: hypothetical protein Fur0018_17390 [Anaerolineales bacterium]
MQTLIAFLDDLMWTPRIAAAVRTAGMQAEFIGTSSAVWEVLSREGDLPPECLTNLRASAGESWHLMEYLTRRQPVLLLLDLGSAAFPWARYLPLLTSAPETRHMPVLCFGPHVQVEAMKRARQLGARDVLARSRMIKDMPALLRRYAAPGAPPLTPEDCAVPLPPEAQAGIDCFNRQAFFDAHEHLEAAWLADPGPTRALYQGILQIGVAYLQIQRRNLPGAVKMFQRARRWLYPLPDLCRGIDVAALRQDSGLAYRTLLSLGETQLDAFPHTLLAPLRLTA